MGALKGICCGLVVLAIAAAPASASTWSQRQLPGEAAKVSMFGVSCPTSSLCVAVGGNNTVASSTNPGGDVSSWNTVYAGAGAQPTGGGIFPGRQIRAVSCPSSQLCVAATLEGNIYTATEPTGSAAAWAVADVDGEGPNTHFYGISCPTAALCVAVAGGGRIVSSTNPTGGAAAWTTTQLDPALTLRAVSCPSAGFCVAVGDYGQVLASANPTGGAAAWQQVAIGGGNIWGVACALPSLCVGGNELGGVVSSTSPLAPAPSWRQIPGGGTVQITGASCVSARACALVDSNGDVLTSTDPDGGAGAWTFANIVPFAGSEEFEGIGNHMFGLSCPTVGFCAVSGNQGQIYASTDPFAQPVAPVKKGGKNRNKRRPKRPQVEFTRLPPPLVAITGKTYRADLRFYAKHRKEVQVRGFTCRIDDGAEKRCRSPKRFRAGVGVHRVRVRAIGWTGLKGPVESYRFRVCRSTPEEPCRGFPARPGNPVAP